MTQTSPLVRQPTRTHLVLRKIKGMSPLVVLSCIVLIVVVICGVAAPLVAPFDPKAQNLLATLKGPGYHSAAGTNWLGTDALGQDLLSRLIYGARISLLIGVLTVLVRGTLGVFVGTTAGYFGGRVDDLMMRIADIQLAMPFLIVAISILVVLGSGLSKIVIVLGLTGWMYVGRLVRSEVLSLRNRDFIDAAKVGGASDFYIIRHHILPNTASIVIVVSTLEVASVILAEASLSFLGLGVGALTPSWGKEIASGRNYAAIAWWLPVFPGIVIFLTVLSINILGDWLRDHWDPRLRRSSRK